MRYVVALRDGMDRDVLMELGQGKTRVEAERTISTGLLDSDGNPIHRVTKAENRIVGFFVPSV